MSIEPVKTLAKPRTCVYDVRAVPRARNVAIGAIARLRRSLGTGTAAFHLQHCVLVLVAVAQTESRKMQAQHLWITGPYQVSLQPVTVPEMLAPSQILVETEHSLISAGTELAIVMGTHIGFSSAAAWPRYPMALGYTAVGRVLAVGSDVSDPVPGERVLTSTAHASHAVVDVATERPVRVPAGCSPDAALLAHLSWIPLAGLRLARPQLGEGMIVFGQGLIGALAARLGRVAGCRPVLGVDPLPDRRQIAASAGIIAVDPDEADPCAVHQSITNGRMPEVVIEATGAPAVIPAALEAAAEMGRVVLMGSPRGRVEIDPYTDIHRKGISVMGAHARVTPSVATPSNPFTAERNRQTALTLSADGSLVVDGLISHHITPSEAPATYRSLAERVPGFMGVIIDWTR